MRLFSNGAALALLARCYASAIMESGVEFDVLFGPAYKGHTIGGGGGYSLVEHFDRDVPFAYNRKEAKTHGEGGTIVGDPLQGKILIIDDVITAGTAVREVMTVIADNGAEPAGVVIGLNCQELGQGQLSAIKRLKKITTFRLSISLI